ncbi:MAG TPA: bifunctional nicotinamidase/pyrazinamidase, partial [Haliscomenobacter sp.]|uniref:bifunctional nicotinamidase/pyrazinamidase n=1 Tax=Haliscomenobacter sp. TaxID=2717303 RepID=UPI002D0642A7
MRTLLLIDLQNDFCPGGALAVEEGNLLIPIANALMPRFDLVLATQDWHPATHGSFAANHPWRKPGQVIDLHGLSQVLWPIHCVQESFGAEFVPTLNTAGIHKVFVKGTDPEIDSYSGFFDNGHRKATGLGDYLKAQGVDELYVMGIATDYCVKFTVLDALELGFKVNLIQDACRGVNLQAGDVEQALLDMQSAGA